LTTYIHSQLPGLSSLRKTSPEPNADIHPDTAVPYGIKNRDWIIIESPARGDHRKGACHGRYSAGCRLLPAWKWQECKQLDLPGYAYVDAGSANPSLLIGSDLADQ